MHLKTDNLDFHQYTVDVLNELNIEILEITRDLYKEQGFEEVASVQTFYEKKFLAEGLPITYLNFRL